MISIHKRILSFFVRKWLLNVGKMPIELEEMLADS